jgi:hypothetical protein
MAETIFLFNVLGVQSINDTRQLHNFLARVIVSRLGRVERHFGLNYPLKKSRDVRVYSGVDICGGSWWMGIAERKILLDP